MPLVLKSASADLAEAEDMDTALISPEPEARAALRLASQVINVVLGAWVRSVIIYQLLHELHFDDIVAI